MARKDVTPEKQKSKQKRSQRQQPQRKGTKSQNKIIRYFQDTRDEIRKVTWPSREEITRLSLIVIGTTVAFGIGLGLLDLIFQQLAALLLV